MYMVLDKAKGLYRGAKVLKYYYYTYSVILIMIGSSFL